MQHQAELEAAIRPGMDFLLDLGYVFTGITQQHSHLLGEYYIAEYSATSLRRQLSLSYFPARDAMSVTIKSMDNYFDWSDAGHMQVDVPGFQTFSGDFVQKCAAFLETLQINLNENYLEVLQGKAYQNDAFDWSPYK